jgi:sodium/bile acid cotransporter 7
MKRKVDWFLPGMLLSVLLAWLFPDPGARGGWLHPELVTKAGVALIFFLHGLALSFASLKSGALQWRLHLVVQGSVFVLFPALGLVILSLINGRIPADLRLGIFFLCACPSTVSSSVALTAAAYGNVPAAVFNATLSSLMGVVLTPLWMSLMADTSNSMGSLGKTILDLTLWLVLPLLIGQMLRPWLGAWATRNKSRINTVDRLTILMLVYTSFCDSVATGVWTEHGTGIVVGTAGGCLVLFYMAFFLTGLICDACRFAWPDRIAAVLCGSKKSMATGVPMAQLMFSGNSNLGLILLPTMIYHPLQLIICGVIANRWARRVRQPEHPLEELLAESEPAAAPPDVPGPV